MAITLSGKAKLDAQNFAAAIQSGTDLAYEGVLEPVEGTILTVMRAAADAGQTYAAKGNDLAEMMQNMVAAAQQAQASTPDLLPVLKQAGVTDSGGQGFVYILEGALRFLQGDSLEIEADEGSSPANLPAKMVANLQHLPVPKDGYGYDVQFLIQGEGLDLEVIRNEINQLGWSSLVVGDEQMIMVHVHTHDPGASLSFGVKHGVINDVVVENMAAQAKIFSETRVQALDTPSPAFADDFGFDQNDYIEFVEGLSTLIFVSGAGFARIFESLGATQVITTSPNYLPGKEKLLEIVRRLGTQEVLILPNNGNVAMVARQVQAIANQHVEIVPTRSMPQGVTALLSFNKDAALSENVRRMTYAFKPIQTIEVTTAARGSTLAGFVITPGDVVGMLDSKMVGVGQSHEEVIMDILTEQMSIGVEVITLYYGESIELEQAQDLATRIEAEFSEFEIEVYDGGQPHCQYIIALE